MKISYIELKNIRSFENANLSFSNRINLILGPNNSGKSSILMPILCLQEGLGRMKNSDVRIGEAESYVTYSFKDVPPEGHQFSGNTNKSLSLSLDKNGHRLVKLNDPRMRPISLLSMNEEAKNHFIYPFLSRRKTEHMSNSVKREEVFRVLADFQNLNGKIDRISNPAMQPAHSTYVNACQEILGFEIFSANDQRDGKEAVYTVRNLDSIPLRSMGEGVENIVALLADMAVAENKLFIIEEPENDIHPRALKKLLDVISKCSELNQFIITTHSNIVLKNLGAVEDTKIFRVDCDYSAKMPTSSVSEISTFEQRLELLSDLGYECADIGLWDYWLFFEEASAESVISDFLIPWFVPEIKGKVRTFSCSSSSRVEKLFNEFNELFVFLHLQPNYKNKAWVLIDSGFEEEKILKKLYDNYKRSGWKSSQFKQFSKHDFEEYYPKVFQGKVTEVLKIQGKNARRSEKKNLFHEVVAWSNENPKDAKLAFEDSAKDVISVLRAIASEVD